MKGLGTLVMVAEKSSVRRLGCIAANIVCGGCIGV